MTRRHRAVVTPTNAGRPAGRRRAGRARPGVLLAAVGLLVASGAAYRMAVEYLGTVTAEPIRLPLPLARIPAQIGLWQGQDVPIPVNVQKVAGNDDFMSRLYTNERTGQWVSVYVAYTARPREMLGHRPRVCYPASGWVHDHTSPATVEAVSGRRVPCLVHRFHW
ncbi:MAG TPA: exosortase-associated EpsI family protein, partial [Halothiobacillaceae bacterium]|nr:exosortase-associated EpsI family protein [Halothiobacillaceae bacterium]